MKVKCCRCGKSINRKIRNPRAVCDMCKAEKRAVVSRQMYRDSKDARCAVCGGRLLVPSWKFCQECDRKGHKVRVKEETAARNQQLLFLEDYGFCIEELSWYFQIEPSTVKTVLRKHRFAHQ